MTKPTNECSVNDFAVMTGISLVHLCAFRMNNPQPMLYGVRIFASDIDADLHDQLIFGVRYKAFFEMPDANLKVVYVDYDARFSGKTREI